MCVHQAEPAFDTLVSPLPQCCSADEPALYAPITAGRYLLDRYAATYGARLANANER